MNKLSEKQVKNLNTAIDKTMDTIDATGVDPNEAIVKVAQDMKLSPDYIPVIVAAYNNGAQYAQRENGNTILEKTAKFPVADLSIINSMLYNKQEKSAGLLHVSSDDFFDYPATMYNDNRAEAFLLNAPVVKAASYTRDNSNEIKQDTQLNERVNTVVESIRMEKSAAADQYDDAIADLAYYLRLHSSPSVPFATKLASTVYGNVGNMVIKRAADRFSLPVKEKSIEPVVNITDDFYKHCEKCVTKLAEYNKICDQELELLSKCASALKPMVEKRVNALYAHSEENDNSPAYFFKKKAEYEVKEAGGAKFFPTVGGYDADARGSKLINSDISGLEALLRPSWRELNPYEHNIMRSLDDPEHESKLREIVVGANLTDLINTDEYLSDQDPEEVLDAYNELMEIAPEIHNKKPLLRAALRQFMESGGIDMQALALIGDTGRKSESRADIMRKELKDSVEKMLDYSASNKSELRRMAADIDKLERQSALTVSEGRKDRIARAEEARKRESSQRRDLSDRLKAERGRLLLQLNDKKLDRLAEKDLENLKNSLASGRDAIKFRQSHADALAKLRSQHIDDFLTRFNSAPEVSVHEDKSGNQVRALKYKTPSISMLNDRFSDINAFNNLSDEERRESFNALNDMGFNGTVSGLGDRTMFFDKSDYKLRSAALPADLQISDNDLMEAAKSYADKLNSI